MYACRPDSLTPFVTFPTSGLSTVNFNPSPFRPFNSQTPSPIQTLKRAGVGGGPAQVQVAHIQPLIFSTFKLFNLQTFKLFSLQNPGQLNGLVLLADLLKSKSLDLLEVAVSCIHTLLCNADLQDLLDGPVCTHTLLELVAFLDWALQVRGPFQYTISPNQKKNESINKKKLRIHQRQQALQANPLHIDKSTNRVKDLHKGPEG